MASKIVEFTLNGRQVEVIVKPLTTVQTVLREQLGYTATKSGCKKGGCGSCTVLLNGESGDVLFDAGRRGGWPAGDDSGGARHGIGAASHSGSVPRGLRPAVRLLHAGHDPGGQGAAGA